MSIRIAGRLDHMHHARDANVAAQRSTGTALMVIKHRVVDDAFRETEIRLVSAGSSDDTGACERGIPAWHGRGRSREPQPTRPGRWEPLAAA